MENERKVNEAMPENPLENQNTANSTETTRKQHGNNTETTPNQH